MEFVLADENVSTPNLFSDVLICVFYLFYMLFELALNDVNILNVFVTCTRGIKFMQPAKRLTLRVKEGFFRLEYGATSKTSMLGPQEELIAQQTIPTRLYLIQIQSLVGPKKNS